jgi:hypothetical protein
MSIWNSYFIKDGAKELAERAPLKPSALSDTGENDVNL